MDEAGHDILNYKNQGLTCLMKPKARAKKKTDTRLENSSHHTKGCFFHIKCLFFHTCKKQSTKEVVLRSSLRLQKFENTIWMMGLETTHTLIST